MLRKIVIPEHTEYILRIPAEYIREKIEILVLPFDAEDEEGPETTPQLSTFRCGGKLRDFSRGDAYDEGM